jgi:hypothetical protein
MSATCGGQRAPLELTAENVCVPAFSCDWHFDPPVGLQRYAPSTLIVTVSGV